MVSRVGMLARKSRAWVRLPGTSEPSRDANARQVRNLRLVQWLSIVNILKLPYELSVVKLTFGELTTTEPWVQNPQCFHLFYFRDQYKPLVLFTFLKTSHDLPRANCMFIEGTTTASWVRIPSASYLSFEIQLEAGSISFFFNCS